MQLGPATPRIFNHFFWGSRADWFIWSIWSISKAAANVSTPQKVSQTSTMVPCHIFLVWGQKCDCVLRFLSIEFLASSWLWLDLFFVNLQGIPNRKNTLLRVIPTMTIIHFVTGKSSGILSDISSGILPGISSAICSGISSGTLSGISSGISSDILSGILSGKSSGILSGKHSGTLSGIPTGILSDILSGLSSGISSGILSGISSGILSGISSGILSGILSGISSGILSGISSGILSGISSVILSGRWGPAVHTELGRSQVEAQRCTLSWEGPRLRSSGAHWARKVPGWGPAVHTELGRSQVEVQRCTLSWEVGKELGEELARRKLRWKLMQT